MARSRTLTSKQLAFVEAYLRNGGNAAAAYRSAYDTQASAEQVAKDAARLLQHPKIAPIVAEAEKRARAAIDRALDRYAVTKERLVGELARLGFSNMLDYIRIGTNGDPFIDLSGLDKDTAAAIGEIVVEEFKDGRGEDARDVRKIRFKLHDKRAALVDRAKLGGFLVERKELRLKRLTDLSDEELDALIADAESEVAA